jgi:NDP-sugar pyrophosphorylase family protein
VFSAVGPEYALVVAAAGEGERLREISGEVPKPLMPLGGVPILQRALASFAKQPPLRAAIVANPAWQEAAVRVAGTALPDVEVVGVEQPEPSGTLEAFRLGLGALADPYLKERPVALLHADNLVPEGLFELGSRAFGKPQAVLFSRFTRRPGSSARIVRGEGGRPVGLAEHGPASPGAEAEICGGLFLFGPWIWERFSYDQPPRRGEARIDALIDELLRSGRASVLRVEAPWHHINTPEDFRLAEQALLRVGEPN